MSYRTIFSIINEHTVSTVSARYAVSLAAACKAELVLYAAHAAGSHEVLLERTERHLDHILKLSSELNIPVTRIIEVGNIRTLLPKRVLAEKAELVVYPLTPDERYGARLTRHTVDHLLQTIRSDLAIVRTISMAKPHPGHILVPLGRVVGDKERRLQFITGLAASYNSKITLFHLFAEREAKGMPDDITRFGKQLQQEHITVVERSGRGTLGRSITVEAIIRHNDLIVLGVSGRGILRRLFTGNPVCDVLQQPPCNVILFRSAL
ncbi:MAG: universal stress protein [Desulfuromonadales bacterium]